MGRWDRNNQDDHKTFQKLVLLRDHARAAKAAKWNLEILHWFDEVVLGEHARVHNVGGVALQIGGIDVAACEPTNDAPPANMPHLGNNAGSNAGE